MATAANAPAEQWNKVYGGTVNDGFRGVAACSDGGYLMAGYTLSQGAGSYDGWLVKVSATGVQQWSRTFGGTDDDGFMTVMACSDGGYLAAGYIKSGSAGDFDGWLVKVSSIGEQQWSRRFGGTAVDSFNSVVACSDGGYLAAGGTKSQGSGGEDCWLVKVSSTGDEQWSMTYGGSGDEWFRRVVACSDGGYLAAGYTTSQGAGSYDCWLVKVSSTGVKQWSKTYGGTGDEGANSVVACSDGGYLLAGYTTSLGAGNHDGWLVKVSSAGVQEWSNTYGGSGEDWLNHPIACPDGGYLIASDTNSQGAGDYDAWALKVSSTGVQEWSKTYGGTVYDTFGYAVTGADGGYLMAGRTYSQGSGVDDGWTVKLAPETVITTTNIATTTSTPAIGLCMGLLCLVFATLAAARRH